MKTILLYGLFCFIMIRVNGQNLDDPRVFNASFYLNSYPDLKNAFQTDAEQAKQHWLTYGIKEGRQAIATFNAPYYLSIYPDLQNAFGPTNYEEAIRHWLRFGINEGRTGVRPPAVSSNPIPGQAVPDADMCWAASYGRGAGTFPDQCGPGQEYDAGLCYPKCQTGYAGVGPVCWASCPTGFRDDGAFCAKPAAYGRGAGYPWKFGDTPFSLDGARARCQKDNPQGCEKSGEIIYPKCKPGFYPVGCCVCSPNCPTGFTDIGVSCTKPSYGRGAGTIPQSCSGGKENQAGLCYASCETGFHGVGPVCWANECPSVFPFKCAAGCAKSSGECISATLNQVVTPLEMVGNIVGIAFTGGGSAVAKSAAKTSTKTIARVTIKEQLKRKAREMGKELAESTVENAANTFYEAQLTGEFSWEDLDPTGVANVVKAFNKPLCKDFK
ncbi:hypothetical protein [Larkinella rosea]|uniref:Uncharacterized protein n=1 Tax=Larkinella rosea TaxID=2025312 RepID=A0A3P1C216_9BACT|nr:hypothetical protein [Larkinella rosea]RRB07308.1 hypothetical protein EHT25_05905 [Larkinella rosea]